MIEETQLYTYNREEVSERRSLPRDIEPTYGRISTTAVKNGASPYLQKLPHARFIQVVMPEPDYLMDQQRKSSTGHRRSTSMIRPCFDLSDINDQVSSNDYLDLNAFLGQTNRASIRPRSAPNRILKKRRKMQIQQSSIMMITIYRNGDLSRSCQCRVTTLDAIFNYSTVKLQMAAAARRLFDSTGREIVQVKDLRADQEYYVSSGESFRDPYRPLQNQVEYAANSRWTMKGIQTDAIKPDSFKTTSNISKRLNKQIPLNICLTIIKNGCGKNDGIDYILIDATRKKYFEKFLEDCTDKMGLNTHAKRAFNYRGEEITSLKEFFRSDRSTMEHVTEGTIYGPIWLTCGEPFRPIGAHDYLRNRYREFVSRRIEREEILLELLMVIDLEKEKKKKKKKKKKSDDDDDEDDESPKLDIKNKDLLSLDRQELIEHRQKFEKEIEEAKIQIDLYRKRLNEVPIERDGLGNIIDRFTNDHIKEIKFDHRIVGRHPLRLIVHRNGTMKQTDPTICLDLRPLPRNSVGQTPIEYLLHQIQNLTEICGEQRPKRVFDINGTELKMICQLTAFQHIFISFGEEFQLPFQPTLAIDIQSVDIYRKTNEKMLLRTVRPEDDLMIDGGKQSGRNAVTSWQPIHQVQDEVHMIDYEGLTDEEKQMLEVRPIGDYAPANVTFIQKEDKLIYPELKIKKKIIVESKSDSKTKEEKKSQKRVFSPLDLQTWFYNKEGYIYNKCLKNLYLTVNRDRKFEIGRDWKDSHYRPHLLEELGGFSVQLRQKTDELTENQIWKFTTDGFIVLKSDPEFALTDLSSTSVDLDGNFSIDGILFTDQDPFAAFAGFCPKLSLESRHSSRQRWAIRQESGFTIGDWRYSKVKNPQWHKLGFVWPVDANDKLIPDLQWPIEGCFIAHVPPMNQLTTGQSPTNFVPIRLQVLKNGERELRKAVAVVGPDISNLIFEPKVKNDVFRRLRIPEPESEQRAQRQIQRMADARQREIKLFLESCTELCKLPFAGRRLFDTRGIEIFDLTSVPRDSYVYVTCGENWIDPALTKAEEQRRLLLANLSHDIRKMFFYCAMRHPKEYSISAETSLKEDSRLVLNRCALSAKQRERVRLGESIEHVIQSHDPETPVATEPEPRTAHERAHKRIDQRDQEKFRWPWERIANESLNLNDDEENLTATGDILQLADEQTKIPKTVLVSLQKFIWEASSGYITADHDRNLVFGVKEVEGKVIDVILKRRNPDDIFQRWIRIPVGQDEQFIGEIDYQQPFLIVSKARPTMALTVLLPSCTDKDPSEMKVSCIGCQITLQQRRYEENGCANQKWRYDPHLGFFFAFNTTLTDQEITAANRANICSYAVHTEDLSQPGFTVSILNNNDQVEDVPVCLACAQAMRGKYRLTKIDAEQKFSCAIGKRTDLKFQGPFHCLNHKADLSRNEAENTLIKWQNQLEELREEASVHKIARTLSAAKTVQMVHLLAYRNGDGRTKPGVKLVGSTVIGLLDQAAHRLNLSSAARRLYLSDGTVILTIEDLIEWAENFYRYQYRQKTKPATGETNTRASAESQIDRSLSASNRFLEGNSSKERFDSVPKLSDIKRAMKSDSQLDMNYLLKFVIEVWVSTGEPFVYPSAADKQQEIRMHQREQRTIVGHDFEKEKHTLRQMKGRRISNQSPGELVSQQNPIEPVTRHGHWTETTDVEIEKQQDVKVLQTSLKEIRSVQISEATETIVTPSLQRLTQHPTTKRVMVYPNGESKESAVACSGTTLEEVMNDAKVRLNLMQPVQVLFDEHGKLIERFEQLTRDQYVVAATNKTFISRTERTRQIEIKASLSRTHREFGEESTDVRVTSTAVLSNMVEPFGPPLLTHDERPKTAARIPPVRRLPIGPAQTTITEVTPSPRPISKKSLDFSDEDDSDSEIQGMIKDKYKEVAGNASTTPVAPSRSFPTTTRSASPLSQLFGSGSTATPGRSRTQIAPKRSDSDDDDDEFMRMIKQK